MDIVEYINTFTIRSNYETNKIISVKFEDIKFFTNLVLINTNLEYDIDIVNEMSSAYIDNIDNFKSQLTISIVHIKYGDIDKYEIIDGSNRLKMVENLYDAFDVHGINDNVNINIINIKSPLDYENIKCNIKGMMVLFNDLNKTSEHPYATYFPNNFIF
jgi:hypothetical protein